MMKKLAEFRDWLFGGGMGAFVLVLLALLLGVGLYWIAEADFLKSLSLTLSNSIKEFAKVLIAVIVIQILTRAWLWKNAIDAFYGRLKIKETISNTAIRDFWWFNEIPWKELFDSSNDVRVVAISANALFTETHVGAVKDFLRRPNTSLKVVLADPTNQALMDSYDEEFSQPRGRRKDRIESSMRELLKIAQESGAVDRISIRFTSRLPRYSCYRFDDRYLFVPYLTRAERSPERIPVICFEKGSFVDKFLGYDLDYVFSQGSREGLEEDWLRVETVTKV
ncbi:MAG: hypothetical protein L0229_29740 [Blastocatellia bacterium]|nr:hypothetical protein [Blastocatellia bacterium]